MSTARVLVVFGTRPEAIKLAPVVAALEADAGFEPVVAVTAQHREMLDQVLDLFGIVPAHDLGILQPGQTLDEVTTRALAGLAGVVRAEAPDAVVVQGDTTTTFVGALAAFYEGVPVAHVEAGLRTDDKRRPFPEEVNRRLTTQLADLHLAPTEGARRNLLRDGVDPAAVEVTGNTVIDALRWAAERVGGADHPEVAAAVAGGRRIVLVTAHRRESWGEGMAAIAEAIRRVAEERPDVLVVFPVHRNPVVRSAMAPLDALGNVVMTEPVPYPEMVKLLRSCHLVLTDSGGIQEEAPTLGKPVLVMRETTERPEGVEAGTARLVGVSAAGIADAALHLLDDAAAHTAMANAVNPYGDGHAAPRCVEALGRLLGR